MTDAPQTPQTTRFGAAFGPTFASLRHRNFRLFFIGQTVSNSGNWLTRVALILLVLHLAKSGFAVGLVSACEFGPVFLLSAWAGTLADRYNKRRVLLWTQSLEMLQSLGLAALAFLPHPPLPGLYLLALIGGILLAFDNPFRRALVPELVPRQDLPNAVVLYSTIVNLSRMFGPALAGILVTTWGYGWAFALDALSYGAVLVCLWLMRLAEQSPGAARHKGEIAEGLRYVAAMPSLWISFAMYGVIGLLATNFAVTLPLFVTDSLHRGGREFTLLYSTFSAGAVASALLVARRNWVGLQHIIWGAALLGATLGALALTPSFVAALVAVFGVGMASILYLTSTTALVQVESRRALQGRVISFQTVLLGGSKLFGGPILGHLADAQGGRAPLTLGALVCLATAVLGYFASARCAPTK